MMGFPMIFGGFLGLGNVCNSRFGFGFDLEFWFEKNEALLWNIRAGGYPPTRSAIFFGSFVTQIFKNP